MSDALKQTGVEYGPWQRTKTIHYEYGAKVIAVESMTEDALRKQLAEAVGLLRKAEGVHTRFANGVFTKQDYADRDSIDAFLARVGEV